MPETVLAAVAQSPHVLKRLPILLLHVHSRCNCRCVMCDIWKRSDYEILTRESLDAQREAIVGLGVERVVFTGGEPLMHPDLPNLISFFQDLGIRLTLLTSGLLLQRHARIVAEGFDEVIVSIDGPPAIHNRIRGVQNAFQVIGNGVRAVHALSPQLSFQARCTVQQANFGSLVETASAIRGMGLRSISFLAADVDSTAFNRELLWPSDRRDTIVVSGEDIHALEAELDELDRLRSRLPDGFTIVESRTKLQRIADHFRASAGLMEHRAPACNAPWVSAVWETDGALRPCFFQPVIGNLSGNTLDQALNSPNAVAFRGSLRTQQNEQCRRCVCSLNLNRPD